MRLHHAAALLAATSLTWVPNASSTPREVPTSVVGAGVRVALAQETVDDFAEPVDLGLYGQPIQFEAPDGVTIELGSGRRLVDTLEVRPNPSGNGQVVIAEMDMEEYVAGVAEMPARWPLEALKAQAVAARTYAWFQTQLGTFERRGLGYDICASTACQVFRGREVVETPLIGANWQQAVAETAGEVLLYDSQPILARYFSTSGGRTRNNEDIFSSEGPRPYLKGIDDPDDAVSPLHTWQAVFTRDQFDELIARGDTLGPTSPVRSVEVEFFEGSEPTLVTVTGVDGTSAQVTAGELKDFLNRLAPEVFPGEFPGPREDGRSLPSTVPSSRFDVVVTDTQVVLDGSGWGHAVGMGQYGAKGKAERGLAYDEILATYYGGIEPTTTNRLPSRIRVGLANDIDEVLVTADGPLRVSAGGTLITERALGTWAVSAADQRTVRLLAPTGYGAPLVVDPTASLRTAPFEVEVIRLETVVNKAAELRIEVSDDGEVIETLPTQIVDAGRIMVDFHPGTLSEITDDGDVVVALVATDEDGVAAGDAIPLQVRPAVAAQSPVSLLSPNAPVPSSRDVSAAVVLLLAAGGILAGVLVGIRSRS